MTASKHYIKTGITAIPLVNQGTHICHFFKDKQELFDVIVPYVKTGLIGNEKCIWITSKPISISKAIVELKKEIIGVEDYISSGQLFIENHKAWYTKLGKFNADSMLQSWIDAKSAALDKGYYGLRAVGVMFQVKRKEWNSLINYESLVDSVLNKHQMIALCSYSFANLEMDEVLDVASNHAMVLVSRKGGLMAIGNSKRAKINVMKAHDLSYASIGNNMRISKQRAYQILNIKKKPGSMLNSSETASLLNVHINTLRRWSNLGLLPVYRIGPRGDRRFKRKDIDHFIFTKLSNKS